MGFDTSLSLMPIARKMKLLRHFMSDWEGEELGDSGLLRILNPNGTRPPLIWCFNASVEFPALAKALGPDQPLIGLRSLNAVVNFLKKLPQEDADIAETYAGLLQEAIDLKDFWIGGNCQGAAVAEDMACSLSYEGKNAQGLFLMEWTPIMPWPGACHLAFGQQSQDFNPFLRGEDPWPLWNHMYNQVSCGSLTGAHGTYFNPENIASLVSNIDSLMKQRCPLVAAPTADRAALLVQCLPPEQIAQGAKFWIELGSDDPAQADTAFLAIWEPNQLGLRSQVELCETKKTNGVNGIELTAPMDKGGWSIRVFGCSTTLGPSNWQQDWPQARTIVVSG